MNMILKVLILFLISSIRVIFNVDSDHECTQVVVSVSDKANQFVHSLLYKTVLIGHLIYPP